MNECNVASCDERGVHGSVNFGAPRRTSICLLLPWALAAAAHAQVLTKAIEVRSLSVAQAQEGREAHLRGRVIFFERAAVFLQDETSTTFFRPRALGGLRPGDEIEVRGHTQPGLFLPGLGLAEFRLVRRGGMPAAIPATYDDLASARWHYHRVAVEGIVRAVTLLEEGRSLLQLAMGTRLVEIRIDAPLDRQRAPVDSRVRIFGLAAGFINERRQLVQPYVRVQDWNEITVLDPGPPPGRMPVISPGGLLAFRVSGEGGRRVRMTGVVTAAFAGGRTYLRNGDVAFAADVDVADLRPGDRVELAGFPEMGGFSASLAHATVLRREAGPPPQPVLKSAARPLAGGDDGDLVRLDARLANTFRTDAGVTMVLQDGAGTLQARGADELAELEPGSRVRVTGICVVEGQEGSRGFTARPTAVSLRIRSAADVTVLEAPSWWTVRRLGMVLAALSGVMALAILWIAALRRQVARQTSALRQKIETEAALEERHRIAREFHDTLEQELAGVTLRLDALATRPIDDKGRQLVTGSRNLVSRIQTETRNLISDLRDTTEASGDLRTALANVASRQAAENGVAVDLECPPQLPLLPPATVHDLRMLAREAVTNAINHGRATRIRIGVERGERDLRMQVADNGAGFDPELALQAKHGHFGCAGMRERARKIGAAVAWRSAPREGAIVEVILPMEAGVRASGGQGAPPAADAAADPPATR